MTSGDAHSHNSDDTTHQFLHQRHLTRGPSRSTALSSLPRSRSRAELTGVSAFTEIGVDDITNSVGDQYDTFMMNDRSTWQDSSSQKLGAIQARVHRGRQNTDNSDEASCKQQSIREKITAQGRLWMLALIALVVLPLLHNSPLVGPTGPAIIGVSAGVTQRSDVQLRASIDGKLVARDDTSTDYCTRWSHQSAIVNGTLYIYGGRATQQQGQTQSTWNDDFLTLPLDRSWQISTPPLKGLTQHSGPPNISEGYLWNSYTSLYVYGGEFSDSPVIYPSPFSLWEYDIASSSWKEHKNPQTSAGNFSDGGNQPVQRAAEGAGISVPSLGRGWYFGGHLDYLTTNGWSIQTARIYLKSLIEYTFPGATNDGIQSLSGGKQAGSDGAWRNITQGGIQDSAGFTERADGVLVFVPGFGKEGIILGLAGGSNESFTQTNIIDVYDIAASTWYKQSTKGKYPGARVNPCATAFSAPDGSSTNVYMFGGQNLIPADSQQRYDDMWILTVPSFTWIEVDTSNQSVPAARAGHTCNAWNAQMVVVGGYAGANISCDSPGIFVFDASALKWQNQYVSLPGGNIENQQLAQSNGTKGGTAVAQSSGASTATGSGANTASTGTASSGNGGSGNSGSGSGGSGNGGSGSGGSGNGGSGDGGAGGSNSGAGSYNAGNQGLSGSYGYQVPPAVISVIGGNSMGGATVTAPAQTASSGPLATGKAITYTVTESNGATVTETGIPRTTSSGGGSHGPNIAAIVAGIVAGFFAILAAYLGFCAWIYRKQLKLYKNHVAASQRAAVNGIGGPGEKTGFLGALYSHRGSDTNVKYSTDQSSTTRKVGSTTGTGTGSTVTNVPPVPPLGGPPVGGNSTQNSSTEDLMGGVEPSFVGVLLNPRRSLRVINRD